MYNRLGINKTFTEDRLRVPKIFFYIQALFWKGEGKIIGPNVSHQFLEFRLTRTFPETPDSVEALYH